MQKERIVFELSVPYSQEQNEVFEKIGRTFMDMTKATIPEENLEDKLWPELVLAITYIKNSYSTKVLANNFSPNKVHFYEKSDLSYV